MGESSRHKLVTTLPAVCASPSQNDVGTLQTAVYDEASVRHTENTALSELVEQLVVRPGPGPAPAPAPLSLRVRGEPQCNTLCICIASQRAATQRLHNIAVFASRLALRSCSLGEVRELGARMSKAVSLLPVKIADQGPNGDAHGEAASQNRGIRFRAVNDSQRDACGLKIL